jgi:hypothetical protein
VKIKGRNGYTINETLMIGERRKQCLGCIAESYMKVSFRPGVWPQGFEKTGGYKVHMSRSMSGSFKQEKEGTASSTFGKHEDRTFGDSKSQEPG